MQSDANPARACASGAGAESPIGSMAHVGDSAAEGSTGSNNDQWRIKRQREQEEGKGMAGKDPGMHMTCMMKIESRADVWCMVLFSRGIQ